MRSAALALLLILAVLSAGLAIGSRRAPDPIAAPSASTPGGALGTWRRGVAALPGLGADLWTTARAAATDRLVEAGGAILERWIVTWGDRALADGTRPMPPAISERLRGYFADSLLDRVRYRVGWGDGRPVESGFFRLLDAKAVALGGIIVFRDPEVAADPVIWAHELAHVEQYDLWGVRGFAERYVRDRRAVESQAWEVAARYTMWALQEGRLPGGPSPDPGKSAVRSTDPTVH